MKLIKSVLKDIQKVGIETYENSELDYVVDARVILENLVDYEVDIPQDIIDNHSIDSALEYMEKLTGVSYEEFEGYNTYNWGGRIMHDLNYYMYEMEDGTTYVAVRVHRGGDVRVNYTECVLLEFECETEWYEVVEDIAYNYCSKRKCIRGKHYDYTPNVFNEYLNVYCEETGDQHDIYAYDNESFEKEIEKNFEGREDNE